MPYNIPVNATLHDASKIVLLAGNFSDRSMDKPLHLQTELFRFLSSHSFDQLLKAVSPTRRSSTLDWFAIDNASLMLDSGILPPLNNLDHSLIFTILNSASGFFTFIKIVMELLRSEIPSGMCAELRTVAASNNRDHPTRSLYYCLFAPHA